MNATEFIPKLLSIKPEAPAITTFLRCQAELKSDQQIHLFITATKCYIIEYDCHTISKHDDKGWNYAYDQWARKASQHKANSAGMSPTLALGTDLDL